MQNGNDKIIEILKKINTPLAYAIILALAGAILIIFPQTVLSIFFLVGGICVLIYALSRFVIDTRDTQHGVSFSIHVISDALLLVLGFALIFFRVTLLTILSRALGTVICIWSIYRLILLSKIEGRDGAWSLRLLLTVLLLVAGLCLLAFPIYPDIMIGITLVILSIHFFVRSYRERGEMEKKDEDVFYTDDFVDKS